MEVGNILLADAANVREGLLNVISAGVSRLWRPAFPAGMGVSLVVLLTLDEHDFDLTHPIEVSVAGRDGSAVLTTTGEVRYGRPDPLPPSELRTLVPLVFRLPDGPVLPAEGLYRVTVRVGDQERSLTFWAGPPVTKPDPEEAEVTIGENIPLGS